MRLTRTLVVTMVTVVLLAMAAPAAQARSIEKPQPVHSRGGLGAVLDNALGNALSWLARIAGREPAATTPFSSKTLTPPTDLGGVHYVPMTGVCIDPGGISYCHGGN